MSIKLAVVYYSSTGVNHQLAEWAAEAGKEAGAEVKLLRAAELAPQSVIDRMPLWKAHAEATEHIPVVTTDDIVWADAIIFSTPTRFGVMASQLKQFLDTTGGIFFEGKTANKVVSAMSSAENPHGGQEATILSLYTMMYHWGAIVVTPGYTDASIFAAGGNPYGTSVTVDAQTKSMKENVRDAVAHQTKRVVEVATWLKQGRLQH
ncbi:NAD(P)H:quinone oxidoreductase [Paenibacillus sp.]|uniref:NAD(P)H:quinone oxidoreductase n=1 Tax=Paenibacillus sp. TaxID=58172 RepID=UPI002D61B7D5|nr:NAD(P)H:quinone oxidoreductase [Paenibacillus sp.]HZG56126.1 NAD(P)H:quinone oxidoreductase [Paenibacillus sp.]